MVSSGHLEISFWQGLGMPFGTGQSCNWRVLPRESSLCCTGCKCHLQALKRWFHSYVQKKKKTRSFHGKIYLFTFMIRVVDPKEFFAFVTNGSINYGQLSIILALPSREANGKSSQKWFPLVKMTETCRHFHTP